MWPWGDPKKSRILSREAGEWEEEAENDLKQEQGTSIQTTSIFQALAEKRAGRRESEMKYRSEMVSHLHLGSLQVRTLYLCLISFIFRL